MQMENIMQEEVKKADYFVRFIAYLIDTLVMSAVAIIINVIVLVVGLIFIGTEYLSLLLFHISWVVLLVACTNLLYKVISISVWGATLGKYIMKIEVISTKGKDLTFWQILCREVIGKNISKFILGTGFALVLVDEKRRALHDCIASTLVIAVEEDPMKLAIGKELEKRNQSILSDDIRFNKIYNYGINSKLSGGAVHKSNLSYKALEQYGALSVEEMKDAMNQNAYVPGDTPGQAKTKI